MEKPFVNSSAEADRYIELAKKKGRILTVFHSKLMLQFQRRHMLLHAEAYKGEIDRRFDSDFRTLQKLLNQDALGEVLDAEIHYDFPNAGWIYGWTAKEYKPGQGMMFGLGKDLTTRIISRKFLIVYVLTTEPGAHTIDQALSLFVTPASVTGFLRANRGIESEIDDTFTIILQYKTNLIVTIKTAVVTNMKNQLKYWIRGTKGTYMKVRMCSSMRTSRTESHGWPIIKSH